MYKEELVIESKEYIHTDEYTGEEFPAGVEIRTYINGEFGELCRNMRLAEYEMMECVLTINLLGYENIQHKYTTVDGTYSETDWVITAVRKVK